VKIAPFTYKLTRLAVLKNYRKQNLGRSLVLALHDWVKQQARMELIDNTYHMNINPTNSTNDSEQEYTDARPTAQTNNDDHPDEDPRSRSMSSDNRNTPSSTKIIAHSQIPVRGFYAR
jgi:GNAT superfamily N-acetyltransferase